MKKQFYSHIVATAEISITIAEIDMPKEDRVKLIALAEENLHHLILDKVLSHLDEDSKKIFLKHLSEEKHEDAWNFIKEKVNDVEDHIINVSQQLKNEMLEDLKKLSS